MIQTLHLPAHLAIERELIPGRTWLVRDARSGELLIAKKSPMGGLRGRWRALAERAGDALEVERELFSREGFTLTLRAFVEGRPLREIRGALQQNDAVALLLAVASRVAALHRKGVVHGNLHSGNAIVGGDGKVRLVDALEQGRHAADSVCAAPEQLRGEPATVRSDLYALGGIAFELLAGRPAFPGTDLDAIRRALYEAPSFAGLSADGSRVLGKALAKDPAQRPGSAEQLAADLHTLAPVARGPTTRLAARSLRSWLGLLGRSLRDRGRRLARVPRAAWAGLLVALVLALWTTRVSLGFSEDAGLRRDVEATLTASDLRRARRLLASPPPRARVETLEKLRGDLSCAESQPVECLQHYRRSLESSSRFASDERLRRNVIGLLGREDRGGLVASVAARLQGVESDLLEATRSTAYWKRWNAVRALEEHGARGSIDYTSVFSLDLLHATSCSTRRAALSRLVELRDPAALPQLEAARTQRDSCLGEALARAIESLRSG